MLEPLLTTVLYIALLIVLELTPHFLLQIELVLLEQTVWDLLFGEMNPIFLIENKCRITANTRLRFASPKLFPSVASSVIRETFFAIPVCEASPSLGMTLKKNFEIKNQRVMMN
jgi:hypothetical protein